MKDFFSGKLKGRSIYEGEVSGNARWGERGLGGGGSGGIDFSAETCCYQSQLNYSPVLQVNTYFF